MSRVIEWDGEPFAILIERGDGTRFLLPPIVVDQDGRLVQGAELLEAVVQSGVTVSHPIIRDANPGDLAAIDRHMAHISAELGVPIGPAGEAP